MPRRRMLVSLLVLAAVLLPIGVYCYLQPVDAEDLNRQTWCMCGDRHVEFKNGTITLLYSPHSEDEKVGAIIGSYKMTGETLVIAGPRTAGDYVLDNQGAHWRTVPGGEGWMGGEFYDSGSWKLILSRLSQNAWQGTKSFFLQDLRKDPVSQVLTAMVVVLTWFLIRKSRRKRTSTQGSAEVGPREI